MSSTTSIGQSGVSSSQANIITTPASQVLNGIYNVGMNSAAGALAGYAFGLINPVGGAIFGAVSALSHSVATGLGARWLGDRTCAKVAGWAISFVASIGAGVFVATAAGFPITVLGGVGLTATSLLTHASLKMVTGGLCFYSKCAAACALVAKESCCPTRAEGPMTGASSSRV